MSWEDRLIDAAYVSPSGTRFPFIYGDLSRQVNKKTSAFNFPDADGTYIQDFGQSGRRYPIRVIFSGEDCDLQATAFENALAERGTGILEHPMYGVINVVPFGSISREDKLVSAANQAVINVTFYETIGRIYPEAQTDEPSTVALKVNENNQVKAAAFAAETTLAEDPVAQAESVGETQSLLDDVKSGLNSIAATTQEVQRQFDNVFNSINNAIDILIAEPLALASQIQVLINAPGRAAALIGDRLDAYQNLLGSITGQDDETDSNKFLINELYGQGYISSVSVSVINATFQFKSEAIEAAETLIDMFDSFVTWRDDNYDSTGLIDTGESYQTLQELVALTEGYLVSASFTLLQEHKFILDRNRTCLDLALQFYPNRDDALDFFINSNNFPTSYILEVPKGTEILYYV